MLMLLINKRKFHEMEIKHVDALNEKHKERKPSKEFPEEALDRINGKRKNLFKSFIWVSFLVVTGSLIANYINEISPFEWFTVRVIRSISVILIAWSVFGRIQDIQTMIGETLLELTNSYLYKWFYSLGIFLASISLFLEGVESA